MAPIKLRRQTADGTFIDFEGDANDYAVVYSVHGADPMAVMLQQTLFMEQLQARLMPPSQPALPPAYSSMQHLLPPAQDFPPQAALPPTALVPTRFAKPADEPMPMLQSAKPKRFNIAWTDFILPALVSCTAIAILMVLHYRKEHPQLAGAAGDKATQTAPAKPVEKPKSDNSVQPFPFALPK